MISTPDQKLNNTQSAFVGRNLIRVARSGIHFYPLICPLGALIVPKMAISWIKCHKGCPYDGFAGAYFQRNDGEQSESEPVNTRRRKAR